MKTYLQLVNDVLRRLRENEVKTITGNKQALLVGDFINQAKRECEDAWNWNSLRQTIQIITVTDAARYVLTGAGQRFRILYDPVTNSPDVYAVDQQSYVQQAPSSSWMTRHLISGGTGTPAFFDINGQDANGDPYIDVAPIPKTTGYRININLLMPQADLATDADVITIPYWPVMLRALAYASQERGEDGGISFSERWQVADLALHDAISYDVAKTPSEVDWTVL